MDKKCLGRWVGWIGAGLVSVGCAVTGSSPRVCGVGDSYEGAPRVQAPDSLWGLPVAVDFQKGLDPELILALDRVLDTVAAKVPGVGAVVAIPGSGVWVGARGVARTSPRVELAEVPRFQVASVTKLFTAVAAMQLVEEGRISLRDPVAKWFPELPAAGSISVDQLLRHTSGLSSFNALDTGNRGHIAPDSVIASAAKTDLLFCPGTNWAYSNTGYVLLGRILEKEEKRPLDSIFAKRLFQPLGLTRTSLRKFGEPAPAGLVSGHWRGVPDSTDYATPYAAGGIVSTALEVTRFWEAVLSGKLLAKETVRSLFTDLAPMVDVADASYGRGVMLYNGAQGPGPMLGHSGGVTGFTSVVAYLVEDRAFVCVLFNDKQYAAEAGLWSLVRTLRHVRSNRLQRTNP